MQPPTLLPIKCLRTLSSLSVVLYLQQRVHLADLIYVRGTRELGNHPALAHVLHTTYHDRLVLLIGQLVVILTNKGLYP